MPRVVIMGSQPDHAEPEPLPVRVRDEHWGPSCRSKSFAPEADGEGFGSLLSRHADVFLSFVVSFLVIYVFWLAHDRAFASVRRAGPALRTLNMLWLLVVAFLPFPTAVVGRAATTATVPVYIGTMFVLSVLTSAMTRVGVPAGARSARRDALAWATTAVFGLCGVVGAVNADLGLFGLLLLIPVRVAEAVGPTVTHRHGAGRGGVVDAVRGSATGSGA